MQIYIQSLFIILLEIFCCKVFFEIFIQKRKKKSVWNIALWGTLFISIDFAVVIGFSSNFLLKQIIVIFIYSFFMGIYYGIKRIRSFIYSILFQGLLLVVDFTVLMIVKIVTAENIISPMLSQSNLLVVFSKSVLFICVLLIKKCFGKKHKNLDVLSNKQWLKLVAFSLMTIISIAVMIINFDVVTNYKNSIAAFDIASILVGMNILEFYLISDILTQEENIRENELFKLKVSNQTQMYYVLSESLNKQRKMAHEYKNQITCLETLLLNKKYDDAEKYVKNLGNNFITELNAVDTNNVIINAVLNTKYQEAKNKKILLVFKVNDLSKVEISDTDIVILLSNLLNNAIEASEKYEGKKVIKIKIISEYENIVLSIKNNYSTKLVISDGKYITTKNINEKEHGYGLYNIINVIHKYEGSYVIHSNDQEFEFSALIPQKNNSV